MARGVQSQAVEELVWSVAGGSQPSAPVQINFNLTVVFIDNLKRKQYLKPSNGLACKISGRPTAHLAFKEC